MSSRVSLVAGLLLAAACSSPPQVVKTYTLGGTVSGLAGTSLVLQNLGQHDLTVTMNGPFTFPGTFAPGATYFITVLTQPTAPTQTCTIVSAQGVVGSANVTSVAVTCSTATFAVGGSVTGLAGTGLVLEDNGGDDLQVSASGSFAFPTSLADGTVYSVTVKSQPAMPTQSCVITSGTGTVSAAVTNVLVACTTTTFTIGGTVSGLSGSGLVLQDNGGDNLTVTSGSSFIFATPVADGGAYAVTVLTQPTNPTQTCTVSGGTGTVAAANVTSITVSCSSNTYAIGVVVTGLTGSGLVLQNNDTDNLTLTANGLFAFATPVASGETYDVTVAAQPTGPAQTCTVTGASGTVAMSNVLSVTVTCAANTYALSGTIKGLSGSGLVLQDNGGDGLSVTSGATTFAFHAPLASGQTYSVQVTAQPSGPTQTCVVSNGSGTVASAPITDIAVSCTTNTYAIGGVVAGLAGTGLVLQDNAGDNLAVSANGAFSFATALASGAAFDVSVETQPSAPAQTCVVTGATGTVVSAAVGSVTVNCGTNAYTVSGTTTGLAGSGLVLSLNSGTGLAVQSNGQFSFPQTLTEGTSYAVTIVAQPASPWQTCTLSNATGHIGSASVSDVQVSCNTNTYPVTVNVTGLNGIGLELQDDGGDTLSVFTTGTYTFATLLGSGAGYVVTVSQQPTQPAQTCAVAGGSGVIADAGINNVTVSCTTNTYTVGGTIMGLAGTVVLQDNASDALSVNAGLGTLGFTFAAPVASGAPYSVTVSGQPGVPSQTCAVTNDPSGIMGAVPITDVGIACTTNTFTIAANVVGLSGTGLVLQDNVGDVLPVAANSTVTFATPQASGTMYTVSVLAQPTGPSQTCKVLGGTGTVGGANVTGVTVNCSTNAYSISGTVSGLVGNGLVVADNLGDTVPISGNGTFAFPSAYPSGTPYSITVPAQPQSPWQTCTVLSGTASGVVVGSDVTNVALNCVNNTYTVSVDVSGLSGSGLQLADNGSALLPVTQNGVSTFAVPVASESGYVVTVLSQPTLPSQTCAIAAGSGTIAGAGVTVAVTCTTAQYAVAVSVSGLTGIGLTVSNNGGVGLPVTGNGTFPFPALIASGGTYDVTVLTQPTGPTQVCTVTSPTGTIAGAAATVSVACVTSQFAVGGIVTGLVGTGLVLQNNTAMNTVNVSANGAFLFPAVASSGAYAVTVQTQPASPTQSCAVTNGSGTVSSGPVTNITVSCTTTAFAVGGTISGYTGSGLALLLNGSNPVSPVAGATSFTFGTLVASGGTYAVTLAAQPSSPTQSCTVASGSGTVTTGNVAGVAVTCTTTSFSVGGVVAGLAGGSVVLQNVASSNTVSVSSDGAFQFPAVASGGTYAVTVQTQPSSPTQSCVVTNGSGIVTSAAVTNIAVACTTKSFTVGGTISGLAGSGLVLQLNGANNLSVAASATMFTFATPAVLSGAPYAVTVATQPTGPSQTCVLASAAGTVGAANVTSIALTCTTNTYTIGVTVLGLSSGTLVLQNNGGNNLSFTAPATENFSTPIASGAAYTVTVSTQPSSAQVCAVENGSGTVTNDNVTNVVVTCGCGGSTPTSCGGVCTSLLTDAKNCSACGNVCPSGTCTSGACVPVQAVTCADAASSMNNGDTHGNCTFSYQGGAASFSVSGATVPITITAWGGGGGAGTMPGYPSTGGPAAAATVTWAAPAGSAGTVYVAGGGGAAYGGGGGGGTFVTNGSSVVVAAGGGAGGTSGAPWGCTAYGNSNIGGLATAGSGNGGGANVSSGAGGGVNGPGGGPGNDGGRQNPGGAGGSGYYGNDCGNGSTVQGAGGYGGGGAGNPDQCSCGGGGGGYSGGNANTYSAPYGGGSYEASGGAFSSGTAYAGTGGGSPGGTSLTGYIANVGCGGNLGSCGSSGGNGEVFISW